MEALLSHLDKLHTTPLGELRIKRNLGLLTEDAALWCRARIEAPDCVLRRRGKNWYAHIDDCIITINAHSYTIITAHKSEK